MGAAEWCSSSLRWGRSGDTFDMLEQKFLATGGTAVVLTQVRARARVTGRELGFSILQTITSRMVGSPRCVRSTGILTLLRIPVPHPYQSRKSTVKPSVTAIRPEPREVESEPHRYRSPLSGQ